MKNKLVKIIPDTREGYYKLSFEIWREPYYPVTAESVTVYSQSDIMERFDLSEKEFKSLTK